MKYKIAFLFLFSLGIGFTVTAAPAPKDNPLREEMEKEARRILQYWMDHAVDKKHGGFYGRVTRTNNAKPRADRSAVLNTRILWSFSSAGRHFDESAYRPMADRAYQYLLDHFVDREHGGVFWMVDYQGNPVDVKKQTYAEAFAIYAFAEYYHWTGAHQAQEEAVRIYKLLEQHAYDSEHGGYLEAFDRDWTLSDDMRLSNQDPDVWKTMNTHLHVLEAYTGLYRVWEDEGLRNRLKELIELFLTTILNRENGHLHMFFDKDWTVRSDDISFGHDIEASWLLTEAAEVLGDHELLERVEEAALQIAEATLKEGVEPDGSLLYEANPHGLTKAFKSWWAQSETMVGFYNAYQLSGKSKYREASIKNWNYIQEHVVDKKHGEWFGNLNREGKPEGSNDKVHAWKAPYHNTRACLEMWRRLE